MDFWKSPKHARGVTLIELIVFMVIVSVGLAGVLSTLNVSAKSNADPLQPKQAVAIVETLLEEILAKDYCDPSLVSAISLSGTLTAGSPTITGITSTAGISTGWQVVGAGIPGNATVTALTATTLTLSANALGTASAVPLQAAVCTSAATVEASRSDYDDISDYATLASVDCPGPPTPATATALDGTSVSGYTYTITVSTLPSSHATLPLARQITVKVCSPAAGSHSLTGYRMPY